MASRTIPFVAATPFGEKLFAGLQKVLAAAKAPVSLVKTDAKFAPADAKHLLAEPLCPVATGELANKYGLTSKVTAGKGTQWYPSSIYPALTCEVVQNLYGVANPYYAAGGAPAPTKALAVKDESAVKLQELQKEADRTITNFFRDEATRNLTATLRVAVEKAAKLKSDRKVVTVVTKPQGELTSPFDEILAQVTKTESDTKADELRASSVSLETSPVGNVWPKLVVFPENVNVVVCPSTPTGDQMTALFVGMAGGTGMVAQQLVGGAAVYTCANAAGNENPTGALLAACDLLSSVGCAAEAQKVTAAIGKAYGSRIIPKDLPGGTADFDAFIEAVAKNC